MGNIAEAINIIEESMKDKFLQGDFDILSNGQEVWKNKMQWERNKMRIEGIIKSDSPRGTWELSEEYK